MVLNSRRIVEIAGFLAVITSLLFVAYEIRQSNRIALGTTAYEIQRNWISINDLVATDEELVALFAAQRLLPGAKRSFVDPISQASS